MKRDCGTIAEMPRGSNPRQPYLEYAPTSGRMYGSYESCLDKLGFLPVTHSKLARDMRNELVIAFKQYTHDPIRAFLQKKDNEAAFRALITAFLKESGPKFWGNRNRDHLEERDSSCGFLYPRDAHREGSR